MRWMIALAVLGLAACGGSDCTPDNAAGTSSVALQGNAFSPSCLKVSHGNTLTFQNQDGVLHTVTTDAGQPEAFDSGDIQAGGQFQHAFQVVGTIKLHCNHHAGMTATVFVQ
jgi:plastocyanin